MGIGAGIGLVGTGLSALGSIQQGQQQADAHRYNAQIAAQQADSTRISGRLEEHKMKKRYATTIGSMRALSAKSGVSFTGSPIMALKDSLTNANLDIAINRYNTEIEARSYESQAKIDTRMAGYAESSGYTGAATTILGGVSKLF
jgi:hypothetical protein